MPAYAIVQLLVTDNLSVGPPCVKLELFCLQKVVDNVVYRDSVVFQCQLYTVVVMLCWRHSHKWGTPSHDHHMIHSFFFWM